MFLAPPPKKDDKKPGKVISAIEANVTTAAKKSTNDDKVYYVDVANTIPATIHYVADDGDIIAIANVDGRTIVTVINESMLDDMSDTPVQTAAVRQPRIKQLLDTKDGNNVQLCEISLGHWRNKLSKVPNILGYIAGIRKYYDKTTGEELENDKNGNVEYKTLIICDSSKQEKAIEILNTFFAENEKVAVEWFIEH